MNQHHPYRATILPVSEGASRPLWSVMIPTYNCAHYLRETLASVLEQDPGIERMQIEVVDDCSTLDDPESVVKELGQGRVSFYRQPENVGYIKQHITPIRKWSSDLSETDLPAKLNFVFIDGDHSYKSVKADFDKVSPWFVEGGILAMHDCTYYESVSRMLGEILATGQWQLEGNVDSLVWLRKVGSETFSFPNPIKSLVA